MTGRKTRRSPKKSSGVAKWVLATVICCLVGLASIARAQDEKKDEEKILEVGKWYPSLEAGLSITQSSYTDNWAGGDRGSVVWAFIANGNLENQLHPKVDWTNQLKLAYGQTSQQTAADSTGKRHWDRPEKSTDLIDYETVFRFTLGGWVDPFASGRFESQFQDASDPAGRTLALNPLKFKESAGIAREFFREEDRSLLSRLGLSLRQTSRRIFQKPAPDNVTATKTANDGGVEWVTDYNTKVLQDRVTWTSKLTVFQPLFYSKKDDLKSLNADSLAAARIDPDVAKFSTTVDVDFENIFTTQITKIVSVSLYTRWIYDKYDNSVPPELSKDGELLNPDAVRAAIRKAGQFKQTLSIGLTYRFL